jgi:hypothetical protein
MTIDYIRIGHEDGLGVGNVSDIEIVGDSIEGQNWGFEVGQSFHKFLGWLSWYGPTKALQNLIFKTALVNIPIFVSEFNHDYIHWPLKERQIYRRWKKESPWGRLFSEYKEKGSLADERMPSKQ